MNTVLFAHVLAALQCVTTAYDNGMALTPPMGWKPWNVFAGNINFTVMRKAVDASASRERKVDGVPTSLIDLGYVHIDVDDNWQACKAGAKGSNHAWDGTPLINRSRFPDLKEMVEYGNAQGAKMGWYTINCICMDTYIIQRDGAGDWAIRVYKKEADLILESGFHGVKIDNCGDDNGIGFQLLVNILNASGKPLLIENSDQGLMFKHRELPTDPHGECHGNIFRTGHDIGPSFGSVMAELNKLTPYQKDPPISRPGCWAHPDMLEVGNLQTFGQSRTHFGAWCIVSAPLYLSFDIMNKTKLDEMWPIITNKEAIAINQEWAGHPGRLVKDAGAYQVWAKKLKGGAQAMLALNPSGNLVPKMNMTLKDVGITVSKVAVRNVWLKEDLPDAEEVISLEPIGPFGSIFLRLTPSSSSIQPTIYL